MTASLVSLVLALLAGSVRAILLWRASTRVDVVNVVVLGTLGKGRARDLDRLLAATGPALYPRVVKTLCEPTTKLLSGSAEDVRARLERDATAALMSANRKLKSHAVLDGVMLAGIAFSGISALIGETPVVTSAAGLVAATLLWIANVRGARHLATGLYVGSMALVDSLIAALDTIREKASEQTG